MNRTTLFQFSIEQKDAGTVTFQLKGIPMFNISLADLSITDLEVAGDPVDIVGSDEEDRPRQLITTKSWTIITKSPV